MKKTLFLLGTYLFVQGTTTAQLAHPQPSNPLFSNQQDLFINNRVLFHINGKPISVLDLKKKMDMVLYKEFPEYAQSPTHRYQFYSTNWLDVLIQYIDRELVIADAKEKQLPITDAEIREQLQQIFGVNYLEVLDQLEFSLDEAWKMAEEEITVERMMMFSVQYRARDSITPEQIKEFYHKYVQEKSSDSTFSYKIITFRNPAIELAKSTAEESYRLLTSSSTSVDTLIKTLKKDGLLGDETEINISDTYEQPRSELSKRYLSALENLKPGYFSLPLEQVSRNSQQSVYRIFLLENVVQPRVESLEALENRIKERLLQEAIAQKTEQYIHRLREHFHISEEEIKGSLPENFSPFYLN